MYRRGYQSIDLIIGQHLQSSRFGTLGGRRTVRRRKADEDVARAVVTHTADSGESHSGACDESLDLIWEQRRIRGKHNND